MPQPQTARDRLRIERAAWMLDARLQDLPRRSRIAKRQELRENLRAAADEVGSRQAVRQLGDLRSLAADYLAAEYGDLARRPSWTATAITLLVVDLVMMALGNVGAAAFRAGVASTGQHATGTFHWHGVPYLISDQRFVYLDGKSTSDGGAWTPLVYAIMLGGAVVAGRLWRLWPTLRKRQVLNADEQGSLGK
jgi:hypothetical protein